MKKDSTVYVEHDKCSLDKPARISLPLQAYCSHASFFEIRVHTYVHTQTPKIYIYAQNRSQFMSDAARAFVMHGKNNTSQLQARLIYAYTRRRKQTRTRTATITDAAAAAATATARARTHSHTQLLISVRKRPAAEVQCVRGF